MNSRVHVMAGALQPISHLFLNGTPLAVQTNKDSQWTTAADRSYTITAQKIYPKNASHKNSLQSTL